MLSSAIFWGACFPIPASIPIIGSTRINTRDFELKLLTLASLVIKADGKVTQKELDYVRRYFVSAYGKARANEVFRIFNNELQKQMSPQPKSATTLLRLPVMKVGCNCFTFLFGIAGADGSVSEAEWLKIESFSRYLKVRPIDFESIKAMFIKQVDGAYKILEVDKSADAEIKKAYRGFGQTAPSRQGATSRGGLCEGGARKISKHPKGI